MIYLIVTAAIILGVIAPALIFVSARNKKNRRAFEEAYRHNFSATELFNEKNDSDV